MCILVYIHKQTRRRLHIHLCKQEVLKVGVTHYFSHAKASRDLGYVPRRQPDKAMPLTARAQVARAQRTAHTPVEAPDMFWTFGFACTYALLAATPQHFPDTHFLYWILLVFVSATHTIAAMWAGGMAIGRGRARQVAWGWFGQTLLMGPPSLIALMRQPV
jgi:hypothetical protein